MLSLFHHYCKIIIVTFIFLSFSCFPTTLLFRFYYFIFLLSSFSFFCISLLFLVSFHYLSLLSFLICLLILFHLSSSYPRLLCLIPFMFFSCLLMFLDLSPHSPSFLLYSSFRFHFPSCIPPSSPSPFYLPHFSRYLPCLHFLTTSSSLFISLVSSFCICHFLFIHLFF